MRVAWATDIHLNFLGPQGRMDFFDSIVAEQPDAVVITGDIAEAPSLTFHLEEMHRAVQRPLYYVLGNHDFYFGSIETVRHMVGGRNDHTPALTYLSDEQGLELAPGIGLVGVDGWGDGRYGDYWRSPVRLNDQVCIGDFQGLDRKEVLEKLHRLGEQEADCLRTRLSRVVRLYPRILVLTHVPPFKEACWYEGRMGNDDWLPFFTCKAVGDVLLEAAGQHPECDLTVLCGHTHHSGVVHMLSNLRVLTGSAEYGRPHVEQVLCLE